MYRSIREILNFWCDRRVLGAVVEPKCVVLAEESSSFTQGLVFISLQTAENQSKNSAHLGTHWVSGSDIFAGHSSGTSSPRATYVCAVSCVVCSQGAPLGK